MEYSSHDPSTSHQLWSFGKPQHLPQKGTRVGPLALLTPLLIPPLLLCCCMVGCCHCPVSTCCSMWSAAAAPAPAAAYPFPPLQPCSCCSMRVNSLVAFITKSLTIVLLLTRSLTFVALVWILYQLVRILLSVCCRLKLERKEIPKGLACNL